MQRRKNKVTTTTTVTPKALPTHEESMETLRTARLLVRAMTEHLQSHKKTCKCLQDISRRLEDLKAKDKEKAQTK